MLFLVWLPGAISLVSNAVLVIFYPTCVLQLDVFSDVNLCLFLIKSKTCIQPIKYFNLLDLLNISNYILPTQNALPYLRCQLKCPVKSVQTTAEYNSINNLAPLLTDLKFLILVFCSSCACRLSPEAHVFLHESHPNPPSFRFMTQ